MNKSQLSNSIVDFLMSFFDDATDKQAIFSKFKNICGKTGQYDVPDELFQKRTSRSNRVLIPWQTVKSNKLTIDDLEKFEGGVAVEFVNKDYFEEIRQAEENSIFSILKNRLGSDDTVSAIISIRSQGGSASSSVQREAYELMKQYFPDYQNHLLKRKTDVRYSGKGNNVWCGYIYYSIRGGQQDTILSHTSTDLPQLFNPACEYASDEVCEDIDLVLSYFALKSIDVESCTPIQKEQLSRLISLTEEVLQQTKYDEGYLLDYCKNHPCMVFEPGKLVDPIQMKCILLQDFTNKNREDDALDLTHNEAVQKNHFFFDKHKQTILGPARPTNLFWSKKLSNMMQQNFSLYEFFEYEEDIVSKRRLRLAKI